MRRFMPIGATDEGHSFLLNGRQWTPPQRNQKQGNIYEAGLRYATHFTPQRFPCFRENGRRLPNISRRVERWLCWHNGFRGHIATAINMRGVSRLLRSAQRRLRRQNFAVLFSDNWENQSLSRLLIKISQGINHIPGRSTQIQKDRFVISTEEPQRLFSLNLQADRRTRCPTCLSCDLPSVSRK